MTETQDAVLRLPVQFALCIFIRVLSDCCRPLHLVSDDYYFSNASKKGADGRVMGIATALEPLRSGAVFLFAPSDLYRPCFSDQGEAAASRSALELPPVTLRISNPVQRFPIDQGH